ncbi:MAG: hypothetical protein H7Y42_17290 [Chitinophagaceae bacterium]|nr:hypothetical protein [Chitinophagaceae bacterium]
MYRKIFLVMIVAVTLAGGCRKEKADAGCKELRQGILDKDDARVRAEITGYLLSLPTRTYSDQTLNALVDAINNKCGNIASILCFDCIDTYPSQSEISISYQMGGNTIVGIIDLSYDSNHQMIFRNLHE